MEREDHDGDQISDDQRIIQVLASQNTVVDDRVLLERLRQYEVVATWPMENCLSNLLIEARALLEPDLLRQIGVVKTPSVMATFLSHKPTLIVGSFTDMGLQFQVPFIYRNGGYEAEPELALIEVAQDGDTWVPRPMVSHEYEALKPVIERLVESATLLVHEAVRRQLGEFDRFFAHVSSPGYAELARAQAEIMMWSQPTTRIIGNLEGQSLEATWTIASPTDTRESTLMGSVRIGGGEPIPFVGGPALLVQENGTVERTLVIAADDGRLAETLKEFFRPRMEDWDHARIIVDRGAVANSLRHFDHPAHILRENLIREEGLMATRTERIRQERMDLDGLKVQAKTPGLNR